MNNNYHVVLYDEFDNKWYLTQDIDKLSEGFIHQDDAIVFAKNYLKKLKEKAQLLVHNIDGSIRNVIIIK